MSKMSRNKGQRGEREVCDILGEALGISLTRTLDQTRAGGCDILLDHFAIEVKRQETLSTDRWWVQACRQAKDIGKHPILIYRKSRTPWLCRMPYSLEADPTTHYVHCDLETLIKRLKRED
jgi:Holliday junction resolvase